MKTQKQIIPYLMASFYQLGWCSGTGGGISIRNQTQLFLAPSAVQKQYLKPQHIFQFSYPSLDILYHPPQLKPSQCLPIFLKIYQMTNCYSIIHSHDISAMLVTLLYQTQFQISNLQMIKGITGYKNTDWLRVPIVENTERQKDLTQRVMIKLGEYNTCAILVKGHGVYIWGNSWEQAKIHSQCYHYLFKAAIQFHKLKIPIIKTSLPSQNLTCWYIDQQKLKTENIQNTLQHRNTQYAKLNQLQKVLIIYKRVENDFQSFINEISKERNYTARDHVSISKGQQNFKQLLQKFKIEHFHQDEQIRLIQEGSGYFDIRSIDDRWIRIHVKRGDFIILPADRSYSIKSVRLFKQNPKWIPIPRPCEQNSIRIDYLKKLQINQN